MTMMQRNKDVRQNNNLPLSSAKKECQFNGICEKIPFKWARIFLCMKIKSQTATEIVSRISNSRLLKSSVGGSNISVMAKGDTYEVNVEPEQQSSKTYGPIQDQSLSIQWKLPLFKTTLRFNPLVSFFSISLTWAFVIICVTLKEDGPFPLWKSFIVEKFSWLYIGSVNVWAVFAIMLYFSKYSDLKLGKADDQPEYNDVTWFVMLFACGIGVGLFFYGVAEPVYHYSGLNRFTADPTMPDNLAAQHAMNLTFYHWGIHSWIVYCIVGMLLALMSHREGLPMTMKSCFYPLIGDRIFGWMGDLVDIISVMTTMFGVCTSLGLGTRQLNSGFHLLNNDINPDDLSIQLVTLWIITGIATVSTASGIGMGIRRLSEVCFGFGMFLMLIIFFMDNTFYILNLFVQSLGYYMQYILQIGWHTDAFEQLGPSAHAEQGRFVPQNIDPPDGPKNWIDEWTMFYWGWWISWSPFVGMFIAKISKGRTIKQFINGTLTAPVIYAFLWMVIFGGVGIRQEREASALGFCCSESNSSWFKSISEIHELLENQDTMSNTVESSQNHWLCNENHCSSCAFSVLKMKQESKATYEDFYNEYKTLKNDFGSTSLDRSIVKLSCHNTEQMWFDVMRSYGDIGPFLAIFSLAAIVLYFVTSSDSGSLVIDCLSSNGDPEPPTIQRIFWALMEGATATALLLAGGPNGLKALQTAGIVSGLPYTFIICMLCVSIWRAVKVAAGDLDPHGPKFAIGLFDCWAALPLKSIPMELKQITTLFQKFVLNILLAPWTLATVKARLANNNSKVILYSLPSLICLILFVTLQIINRAYEGCWAIAWVFYLAFATLISSTRMQVRHHFNINGNAFEDFFASMLLYPNVVLQMDETTKHLETCNSVEFLNSKENIIA